MTTAMETVEQIAILEEVLDLFDQAAEQIRLLRNERIEAYCLAVLEGSHGCPSRALRPGRAGLTNRPTGRSPCHRPSWAP